VQGIACFHVSGNSGGFGKAGIVPGFQVLLYIEGHIYLTIEIESAFFVEEITDLLPVHFLAVRALAKIEYAVGGVGFRSTRFYSNHNNAFNDFNVDRNGRLTAMGMVLNAACHCINILQGFQLPRVSDTDEDPAAGGVGKGAELPTEIVGKGLFEFEVLAFAEGGEFFQFVSIQNPALVLSFLPSPSPPAGVRLSCSGPTCAGFYNSQEAAWGVPS
jgi:hypothetical protein